MSPIRIVSICIGAVALAGVIGVSVGGKMVSPQARDDSATETAPQYDSDNSPGDAAARADAAVAANPPAPTQQGPKWEDWVASSNQTADPAEAARPDVDPDADGAAAAAVAPDQALPSAPVDDRPSAQPDPSRE